MQLPQSVWPPIDQIGIRASMVLQRAVLPFLYAARFPVLNFRNRILLSAMQTILPTKPYALLGAEKHRIEFVKLKIRIKVHYETEFPDIALFEDKHVLDHRDFPMKYLRQANLPKCESMH